MKFILCSKARLQWAGLLAPAVVALHTSAAPASAPAEAAHTAARTAATIYSVTNLGPDTGTAVLNQRGQATFTVWSLNPTTSGFFDGKRVHTLGSLGGAYTQANGLTEQGVVVGESSTASEDYRGFSWTLAGGMRSLSRGNIVNGPTGGSGLAINGRNQVVGRMRSEGMFYPHAKRWNSDGSVTSLGPMSARMSSAIAINNKGVSVGDAELNLHENHVMVWDAAGKATDLGRFGGKSAFARDLNESGQVLAVSYDENNRAASFLWSQKQGTVRIGADGAYRSAMALNNFGDVAGTTMTVGSDLHYRANPFIWSLRQGLRQLPLGSAQEGNVLALNNRREMVGYVYHTVSGAPIQRAVYWNNVSRPVDLNTRLFRAPAGLVLYSAQAINDSGAIVAMSNAGLVLLRPGTERTAAPVLGPVTGIPAGTVVTLHDTVDMSVNFVDSAPAESHVASASIDDGCPQSAPSLREWRGQGDVSLRHTFCRLGPVTVQFKVTDRAGNTTVVQSRLFVNNPSETTLVGSGQAAAPSGKLPLHFALWAPLNGGSAASRATAGTAVPAMLSVSGPFEFRAETVGKSERNGESVWIEGTGRFNGRPGYRFTVEASPGNGQSGAASRMRLRISHTDPATKAELVDYDNGAVTAQAAMRTLNAALPLNAPDGMLVTQGSVRLVE